MPTEIIYALGAGNITVSGGQQLSGITQGAGNHLLGQTITLDANAWEAVAVSEAAGDANFDDSDNSQTLDGAQSFDGTPYSGGQRVEAEYSLTVQDPSGNSYTLVAFNINEGGGASYATVEGLAFVGGVGGFPPIGVPLTVVANQEGPSVAYAALATPPCFTPGARIDTPRGPVPVECLRAGDLVMTRDDGPQPLIWAGRCRLPEAALARNPGFAPVTIIADAFGPGVPARDLTLSPQHRLLVAGWPAELLFGEAEVLVPAGKLLDGRKVRGATPGNVTYLHLLTETHQVIRAEGLPTETLLPGGVEAQRLFPDLPAGVPARVCIERREAALAV